MVAGKGTQQEAKGSGPVACVTPAVPCAERAVAGPRRGGEGREGARGSVGGKREKLFTKSNL